jgi:nucleoside-diphosphate-sugar epimerase
VTDVIPARKDEKAGLVLVTGARGFIGRAMVKVLQREGYGVIALDQAAGAGRARNPNFSRQTPAREMGHPSRLVEGLVRREALVDITDSGALRRHFEKQRIGCVVHLAAVLPTAAQRDPERATQVNVIGSLNLLEMARRFKIKRFVFGSSLSVYGTCPKDEVVAESHRAAPEDLYGAAKLYVEQMGRAYREKHGLEFVSLRIGRVVGAGAKSSTSAWRSQIFEGLGSSKRVRIELPYLASERLLLVHVEDVARMLVELVGAERPAHLVYNAVCESVVVADLKLEVERLNGKVRVEVGEQEAVGNPRRLDSRRFSEEFGFRAETIFERLRGARG